MTPAELQSKMIVWRAKCLDGSITQPELTEAMAALRGERKAAGEQTPAKRAAKAKAVIPTADDMLAELGLDEPTQPKEDSE